MRIDVFDYELPEERIAQHAIEPRDAARLLVVRDRDLLHRHVSDLADLLPGGALVVVNDTRVFPARILGKKAETGGKAEIFLLENRGPRSIDVNGETRPAEIWRALGKSSKPFRFGSDVIAPPLVIRLLARADDGLLEVALTTSDGTSVHDAIERVGRVPLPPYIHRDPDAHDAERYQTVFARNDGAVAAPTAGLHLTDALLEKVRSKGCEIASVTLHVGLGTFQPVTAEDLDAHPMHSERFEIPRVTADAIARKKAEKKRIVAIGTTVVRALESAANEAGHVEAKQADTRLLIQPGYSFKVVDQLLTNFHLPKSTLLALVCAFAGTERVLSAYRAAVEEKYRFYSYGDAMLLTKAGA